MSHQKENNKNFILLNEIYKRSHGHNLEKLEYFIPLAPVELPIECSGFSQTILCLLDNGEIVDISALVLSFSKIVQEDET